jgi:hypothetical protein
VEVIGHPTLRSLAVLCLPGRTSVKHLDAGYRSPFGPIAHSVSKIYYSRISEYSLSDLSHQKWLVSAYIEKTIATIFSPSFIFHFFILFSSSYYSFFAFILQFSQLSDGLRAGFEIIHYSTESRPPLPSLLSQGAKLPVRECHPSLQANA